MPLINKSKPLAICMTGISGSGKTTLAEALVCRLRDYGIAIDIVDGDVTRKLLGDTFGYSKEERVKIIHVYETVGWYLLRNKISFVMAIVMPFEEIRSKMRDFFGESYIEIYVKASLEACSLRDTKGLYKESRKGTIENLNGGNGAFEPPQSSNVTVDTEQLSVEECCKVIIEYLHNNNYITQI